MSEPADYDLQLKTVEQLRRELMRYRTALREHRDEKGHERCWESDFKLYLLLPEADPADFTIPPDSEHEERCRLWRIRNRPPCLQSPSDKLWEVHIWCPGEQSRVRADFESRLIGFDEWVLETKTEPIVRVQIVPEDQQSLNYSQVPPRVKVKETHFVREMVAELEYTAHFYRIHEDIVFLTILRP